MKENKKLFVVASGSGVSLKIREELYKESFLNENQSWLVYDIKNEYSEIFF